jgi:Drought induced 19 protein (Di19), zinc-binding
LFFGLLCAGLYEAILSQMFRSSAHGGGGGGEWVCAVCGKTSLFKNNIARHVEARHMTNASVVCTLCGRTSKTRDSLRKHVKNDHS